jgi:hypothetical protein
MQFTLAGGGQQVKDEVAKAQSPPLVAHFWFDDANHLAGLDGDVALLAEFPLLRLGQRFA